MIKARWWLLGTAAASLLALAGCGNLGGLVYFLTPEQPNPARLKHLAHKDEKQAPRVVLLTHCSGGEIDTDLIHADREVAERLSELLRDTARGLSQKVDIIQQRKVEEYKNRHLDWKHEPMEAGKAFKARYVVFLEFLTLSMRDHKSPNLYTGKAQVRIQLYDLEDDGPPRSESCQCSYPTDVRGFIPADSDTHPEKFRRDFLNAVAKKIVPYLIDHPRQDRYSIDRVSNE
jgi:hypothetical protein